MSGDDDDVVRVSRGEVSTMLRCPRTSRAAKIPGCESNDDDDGDADHPRWVPDGGCQGLNDTWLYATRDGAAGLQIAGTTGIICSAIADALFVYISRGVSGRKVELNAGARDSIRTVRTVIATPASRDPSAPTTVEILRRIIARDELSSLLFRSLTCKFPVAFFFLWKEFYRISKN